MQPVTPVTRLKFPLLIPVTASVTEPIVTGHRMDLSHRFYMLVTDVTAPDAQRELY